jgi:hypothetical protein
MAKCLKHNIGPESEEWQVAFEEASHEGDDDEQVFENEVCPLCYVRLLDKYRRARREAKTQARKAISAGQEALRHAEVVRVVIEAVKGLGGQDAFELVHKKFPTSPCKRGGIPPRLGRGLLEEAGDMKSILPNLITELASKAKREGFDRGKRDIQGTDSL